MPPIINPVDSRDEFPPAINFAGGTDMTAALTVAKTASVVFTGGTAMVADSRLIVQAAVAFNGGTAMAAQGRLNSEANVFGSVEFAGSTDLTISESLSVNAGIMFAGGTEMSASATVERAEDLSFTFFVDIADVALSGVLNSPANIRRYTARLLVDGINVPIRRAELDASDNKLGTELSVILARPDVSQVTATASIDFQLGVWASGAWRWLTLLSGGKMSGRGAHYANRDGLPADSVEVTFVDVMGDRSNRAPRAQTVLYDPQAVDAPTADTITSQTIYDGQGNPIAPIYTAISGMRLRDVLYAAYVTGCGFSRVVTNIDNFPVEQAVFSLSGGYNAGVRPLLVPFKPIVFVVGNDLWIVTLDNPLPAGFAARAFPASGITEIDDQLPQSEQVNALLVHLKDNGAGEYYTERLESKTEYAGEFGGPDYTETDIERRVREWRNFASPTTIQREEELYLRKRTINSDFQDTAIDERRATFDSLNRPTGYTRTLKLRLPTVGGGDGDYSLRSAESESQFITYAPHPLQPERDVQSRIETRKSGLVLSDNDNQYLDKPYRLPTLDAHRSGYIDPEGDQTESFEPIRTIIETMRVNGGQVVRDRQVVNHISGVPEPPTTQILPGDASFDRRRQAGKTRTVLLTIEGTDAQGRRVQEFDGTGLPSDVAMRLAEMRLARLNARLGDVSVQMPFVDPTLRRGSDLLLHGRSGAIGTYIVRGTRMVIEGLDTGVVEATMRLTAQRLS